jgi:hypothetical protein
MLRAPMVSATQQTSRIRARKAKKNGNDTKRKNRKSGTPAFAVHPAGYDPTAADAKPAKAAPAAPKPKDAKPKAPKAAKAPSTKTEKK